MKMPEDARLCPACSLVRFGAPESCPGCGGPMARVTGRGNKYHAKGVHDPDDGYFHSRKELKRWRQLKLMEIAGAISRLRRQVKYDLVVNGVKVAAYRADFVYVEGGEEVTEDCKGFLTEAYRMKRNLMLAVHGIRLRET